METIVACRSQISDRFPVASFAIRLPSSRFYEVACATDPRLFHTRHRRDRTRANFFTSREHGLLQAPRGETAWMLPPDQLQRFAGARRVYYALASYGSPGGNDAHFTIGPESLDRVPSIGLAADFTGRSLDRTRIGHARSNGAEYGGDGVDLVWGGDFALAQAEESRNADPDTYDDGHDGSLWQQSQATATDAPPADPTADADRLSDDPPTALAIAAESAAECGDAIVDEPSAVAHEFYGGAAAMTRDDEEDDDEHAEAMADVNDGDDEEDTQYGGYEDAAALYGAVYGSADAAVGMPEEDPSAYGSVATALEEEEAALDERDLSTSMADVPAGRDPDYRQDDEMAEAAEFDAAIALALRPLDIPEKVRLLRIVARAESGRDGYAAVAADPEYNDPGHPAYRKYHIGLSWGFIQFTQRGGSLGKVLDAAYRRSTAGGPPDQRFEALFGSEARQLLEVTNARSAEARVAPVGGHRLWEAPWVDRFRRAGRVGYVAAAQNEIAVREFVDPVLPVAAWLGLTTPRALAMLIDRAIHMGPAGGVAWVLDACGPLKSEEDRRRALAAVGAADLAAFQRSKAPHLKADNQFGPRVHAALVGALRRLGSASPIPIPGRDALVQRLVDAAASRRFAARLRMLHENRADFDDTIGYDLVEV